MAARAITGARYGGRIIATARDSWSPTAPPRSGLQALGRVQARAQVQVSAQRARRAGALPRAWGAVAPGGALAGQVSFCSQLAVWGGPPAGGRRGTGGV